MKVMTYKIELIHFKILVFFCDSDTEIKKLIKKIKYPGYDLNSIPNVGDALGTCISEKDTGRPIILYIDSKNKKNLQSTIIHECTHVLYHLQRYYGFLNENEFSAYIMGALTSDILNFCKK